MVQSLKINCDICNKELSQNEIGNQKVMLGLGGEKPKAKNHLLFIFEGAKKEGDLCFSCSRKIRDKLEDMKEKK